MIVHIFPQKSNKLAYAMKYNTGKIDRNDGELMRVANFGALLAFTRLRKQDYINYLLMVNALNPNIKRPHFHATISAWQKRYDKSELTAAAEAWMKEMGFGDQPYMIVYHKDTSNNHLHIVSTKVTKEGRRIDDAWEYRKAQKCMDKILGYEFALQYRFSSPDQFLVLLKKQGYFGRNMNDRKIQERISLFVPEPARVLAIRQIFNRHMNQADFELILREKYSMDLAFQPSEGKEPDGYCIIDHKAKQVFNGSEVIPLKFLLPALAPGRLNEAMRPAEIAATMTVPPASYADEPAKEKNPGMERPLEERVTPIGR